MFHETNNAETKRISMGSLIAPAFHNLYWMIEDKLFTSYWLKGGRGSTKSSFAALKIIEGIMEDSNANGIAFRKVGDTIRTSILETLLWAIEKLEVSENWSHTVSPPELTYLPTGQKIILKGLDKALKLKSIKLKKGYFKFVWFEEAAEFGGMVEIRNVEQSVMRGGDHFVEFLTYNPPNDPNAWVNEESKNNCDNFTKDGFIPDRYVHHSDYTMVPAEWLGEQFIMKAEQLKRTDPTAYEHEYMGKAVGRAEQIIYHGKFEERDFDTPSIDKMFQQRFFFGADWGFSQDPMTLVRMFIIQDGMNLDLYIDHEVGGVGIENEQIAPTFRTIPEVTRWLIYADNARPETISYVSRQGFNIEAAMKWPGSVEDGISFIKSFRRIYVHPRCPETLKEFKTYSYKVDKLTQKILPVVADKQDDHYMDAIRYGLSEYITADVSILQVL